MAMLPMPFNNPYTYNGHGGMDYGQPRGTVVRAEGSGYVDWSGYYSARGGYAKFITFDNGERRGYYHFDKEQGLKKGDRVEYGTAFAYVGSLGLASTGPHLHHEVWINGSIIAPPAYWKHVDRNHYVGDGSGSGGGGVPVEGFLMALTDTQQRQIYDALVSPQGWYMPQAIINVLRGEVIKEGTDVIKAGGIAFPGAAYNAFQAIANQNKEIAELVKAIDVSGMTPEQIDSLAQAVAQAVIAELPDQTLTEDGIADAVRAKFAVDPLK